MDGCMDGWIDGWMHTSSCYGSFWSDDGNGAQACRIVETVRLESYAYMFGSASPSWHCPSANYSRRISQTQTASVFVGLVKPKAVVNTGHTHKITFCRACYQNTKIRLIRGISHLFFLHAIDHLCPNPTDKANIYNEFKHNPLCLQVYINAFFIRTTKNVVY